MLSEAALLALLWSAVAVVVLGVFVLRGTMPPVVALGAMLVKVAIAAGFAMYGDHERWTLLDDLLYYQQGREFLSAGGDPFTFLFDSRHLAQLVFVNKGLHVLYGWYNYLAQWLIGPYYFAPVLLNVLATAVAARAMYDLVLAADGSVREARWTAVLLLLHWDVLAWSSFINVKDSLCLTGTILLFLAYVRLGRGITRGRLAAIAALSVTFFFLRFYVPVLALGCFLATSAAARGALGRHRWRLLSVGALLAAGLAWLVGPGLFRLAISRIDFSPGTAALGVVRILLTPQPWSISANYEYLLVPSVLHLLFLVPALVGLWLLWRRVPRSHIVVVYYVAIVVLFSAFPQQQGPRHRYQAVFVLVWGLVHAALEAAPVIVQWIRAPRATLTARTAP